MSSDSEGILYSWFSLTSSSVHLFKLRVAIKLPLDVQLLFHHVHVICLYCMTITDNPFLSICSRVWSAVDALKAAELASSNIVMRRLFDSDESFPRICPSRL